MLSKWDVGRRISELEILINTTDPDIIIGNETWLKPDINQQKYFHPPLRQGTTPKHFCVNVLYVVPF